MFWQENIVPLPTQTPINVSDLAFTLQCKCLPLDHAYSLSQALQTALPWLTEESQAGVHLIHGAESGNGWERPCDKDELLYLSRRTKLTLRLPQHRFAEAQALEGQTLPVGDYTLQLGKATPKALQAFPVVFARHVLSDAEQSEADFLQQVVNEAQSIGVVCRKVLCGKTTTLRTPTGDLSTRSVMLADLTSNDSLLLQQQGLGQGKLMGCGLLVPHKDIKAVDPDNV